MQCFYRSKLLYALTGALFFLLFPFTSVGGNSLDEHVFLTRKNTLNFQQDLHDGYRAFIISPKTLYSDFFTDAEKFLEENGDFLFIITEQETPEFLKELEQNKLCRFLAIPGQQTTNNLSECISENKRLFVFTPGLTTVSFSLNNLACTYNVPAEFPDEIASGFTGKPENDLVVFYLDDDLNTLPDSLQQNPELIPRLFNEYTGKLPNFFVTGYKNIFNAYQQTFSKQEWFSANVIYNEQPLEGITWKEMPGMESFGKIHTTQKELSPYKDGFHFSPDVFTFNSYTSDNIKIFYARPKDLKDGMVLMLPFEQNVNNAVAANTEIPYSNIEYKNDSLRGWCAVFNGKDNYIDYDTDIELNNNFTVSAWIKPTDISGNRSIIGKGKALSVKFRNGNLLFTSPGIKDHVIDSAVVKINEWQQITFVISIGKTVRFFKNGELVGVDDAANISSTEYSLLIGTNLWDEAFKGMMDDLTIWDRALSDIEVKRLYKQEQKRDDKAENNSWLWILPIIFLLVIFPIVYFQNKKKKRLHRSGKPQKAVATSIKKKKQTGPFIEVFGGFRIVNREGEELTSRFSTRRKQLFVLVLVATLRENGASSKQLTNHLWAGYPAESAKNNRSTQVQRIREILDQNSGINIEYTNKKWVIQFNDDVYCDLADYFLLIEQFRQAAKSGVQYELLNKILCIIEKGPLLPNMDDVWLDDFKSRISDELLETLLPLYADEDFMQNQDAVLRLSNALLIFDPLNEAILSRKLTALVKLGKNTQAHESLEHFEKYYQQCYAQPFGKSISELIEQK
ncbi:MAG: LamG-like jellyroll fold domain-containing protein [Draconibacterium sp.]